MIDWIDCKSSYKPVPSVRVLMLMRDDSIKHCYYYDDDSCIAWAYVNMPAFKLTQKKNAGENHHNSKLTQCDVEQIRQLHDGGMSYGRIAAKYDVAKTTIFDICNYVTWRD